MAHCAWHRAERLVISVQHRILLEAQVVARRTTDAVQGIAQSTLQSATIHAVIRLQVPVTKCFVYVKYALMHIHWRQSNANHKCD